MFLSSTFYLNVNYVNTRPVANLSESGSADWNSTSSVLYKPHPKSAVTNIQCRGRDPAAESFCFRYSFPSLFQFPPPLASNSTTVLIFKQVSFVKSLQSILLSFPRSNFFCTCYQCTLFKLGHIIVVMDLPDLNGAGSS